MKDNNSLLSENFIIEPENQFFFDCYAITKKLGEKEYNLYKYKLEAADVKIRFAALAYDEIKKLTNQLEIGEFIYFDDNSRLKMSFYLESFLVYSRAALDLSISSYYTYFHGTINLDSINDFIKKIKKDKEWLPIFSKVKWDEFVKDYDMEEYSWVKALVGASNGVSLRDKVVHKGSISIDTMINESNKGCFIIHLNSKEISFLVPWLIHTSAQLNSYLNLIKRDIIMTDNGTNEKLAQLSKQSIKS